MPATRAARPPSTGSTRPTAVDVLVGTTAALAELARHIGPYVGDFWPPAGARVAEAAIVQASTNLDTSRHHVTLVPAADYQPATDGRLSMTTPAVRAGALSSMAARASAKQRVRRDRTQDA